MSANRIAGNALATFTRVVFSAAITLFSSRWVLNSLGSTDYGIFNVVGSIIVFITFINNIMASGAARHFAYSIGEGRGGDLSGWFNASLGLHIFIAFILAIIGWPLGEYVVSYILNIPDARLISSILVFRISLVAAFFGMLSVPFVAMFNARQHIGEVAVWGVVQSVLIFVFSWGLAYMSGDLLVVYAAGMAGILIFIQLAQIIRAIFIFPECQIFCNRFFDGGKYKELFSFASWNMFGWSGVLLREQGSAIMVNIFLGPNANAAYSIANQVSNQANQLTSALISALSPAVTSAEGSGNRAKMLQLSQRASKFASVMSLLMIVPLILAMETVLSIWLGFVPSGAPLLCQLILIAFVLDRLSTGYMLAINACGKIAAYQVTLGTCQMLALPIVWVLLKNGNSLSSLGVVFIFTVGFASFGRVLWGRHFFGISIAEWGNKIVIPCGFILIASVAGCLIPRLFVEDSIFRALMSAVSSVFFSLLLGWRIVLTQEERCFVRAAINKLLKAKSFSQKS